MKNVAVIVPCADRKRCVPTPELTARNLPRTSVNDLARAWAMRVSVTESRVKARDLYCGRAFKEALVATENLSADLKVISAGLGVVDQEQEIPSYSVTVASGSQDSILKRVDCGKVSSADWWRALRLELPGAKGLRDEVRASGSSLVLVVLTEKYAEMLGHELEELDDDVICRLRVFGAGIAKHLPEKLAPTVMPYDERFDGPQSPSPGTMSDFGSRALRHYSDLICAGVALGEDLAADRSELERHMVGWTPRKVPVRKRLSDDHIIEFIQTSWEETGGRSQTTLRLLQDSGCACEQGRFRDLFHRARAQRQSQEDTFL